MAAYLEQRAAAATTSSAPPRRCVHLDEARSALVQLATLQVRNLAFVKRVDGFGAYEPLKAAAVRTRAPVTVYAEVENFASTSTEDGYETRAGDELPGARRHGTAHRRRPVPRGRRTCAAAAGGISTCSTA